MKKKEYIEKIANLVVNRVKYHAPRVKDEEIDYGLLRAISIDEKYPIFVFDKPLNKLFFSAFLLAKTRCKFNLILTKKPLISISKIAKVEQTYLIFNEELGINFNNLLTDLNVNYSQKTDYKIYKNKEYLKINNEEINFNFIPFYNYKKYMKNGVIFEIKQFLLNGKNYAIDLTNTGEINSEINLEINIPLPQGYYLFKKRFNYVEIINLTNKNVAFFNFFIKDCEINFSCIDGISFCTYSSVNLKCKINLKGQHKQQVFFNFGEQRFDCISVKDMQNFFQTSQLQMQQTFNTRVRTTNQQFDDLFNFQLPKNIYKAWSNFSYDETSENKWLEIRGQLLKNTKNGFEVSKDFKHLKEVKFFHNNIWKRVFIVRGESTYLFAGHTKYYNYTSLSKELFDKNNEIYLSFGG